MMDRKVIRQAIESAERELGALKAKLAEMEPLTQRKVTLEAFIAQAKALLGEEKMSSPEEVAPPPIRPKRGLPSKDHPVWAGAREVLSEAKRPMTAGEIFTELVNRGWKLSKEWGMEVVRAGMSRKLDIFERVEQGWYALREWPEHFKKATKAAS